MSTAVRIKRFAILIIVNGVILIGLISRTHNNAKPTVSDLNEPLERIPLKRMMEMLKMGHLPPGRSKEIQEEINKRQYERRKNRIWHVKPNKLKTGPGKQNNNNQTCTIQFLRSVVQKNGDLPSSGSWQNKKDTGFYPDLCKFGTRTNEKLKECYQNGIFNAKDIVILGDSNGRRYFNAFLSQFKEMIPNIKCRMVKEENKYFTSKVYQPDRTYYGLRDDTHSVIMNRECHGCKAGHLSCFDNVRKTNLSVEYLSLVELDDISIRTLKQYDKITQDLTEEKQKLCDEKAAECQAIPNKTEGCHHEIDFCFNSKSTFEFIFNEYLSARKPDMVLIFLPFEHDVASQTAKTIHEPIENLYQTMLQAPSLAETKQIFLFTNQRHHKIKKALKWQNVKYEGNDINKQMEIFSKKFYETSKHYMSQENSKFYPFFDLMKMSISRLQWNTDGVHYQPVWYEQVIKHLFLMLCNSV